MMGKFFHDVFSTFCAHPAHCALQFEEWMVALAFIVFAFWHFLNFVKALFSEK